MKPQRFKARPVKGQPAADGVPVASGMPAARGMPAAHGVPAAHGLPAMGRRAALSAAVLALAGVSLLLPTPARAASHTVVIEAMSFAPPVLEASVGDTVVWVNKDPFPHTATAEDRSFDSEDIAPGERWTLELNKEGEFPYFCSLHPTMRATLIVKRR